MELHLTVDDIEVRVVESHVTRNNEFLFTVDGHYFSVIVDEPLKGGVRMHIDSAYVHDSETVVPTEWYESTNPDNDIWCPRYERDLVEDTTRFAKHLIVQAKAIVAKGYWL